MDGEFTNDLVARLERHEARRERGMPTVSVLAGPGGDELLSGWLAKRGRAAVICGHPSLHTVMSTWAAALANGRDVLAAALEVLAALPEVELGIPAAELGDRLSRMYLSEREGFFLGLARQEVRPALLALLRCTCELQPDHRRSLGPEIWPHLWSVVGAELGWRALARELAGLVPRAELPGLILSAFKDKDRQRSWIQDAASLAEELVAVFPHVAVAIAAPEPVVRDYLEMFPETRSKAAVREGLIRLAGNDASTELPPDHAPLLGATRARIAAMSGPPEVTDALARGFVTAAAERARALQVASDLGMSAGMGQAGAAAGQADQMDEAGRAAASATAKLGSLEALQTAEEAWDRARSAAERFLFAALQAEPATRGLFVQNERLQMSFGGRGAEVDLLARRLGLVVEVDGYHHFRDAEAYRRDRRKDVLLQLNDLVVIRCLAEDVVTRLDEVLAAITAAVDAQRQRRQVMP